MLNIEYIGHNVTGDIKGQVFSILNECDNEFCPPLSARNSTAQTKFSLKNGANNAYFDEMIKQDIIIATDSKVVVGFIAFKRNYTCDALSKFGKSLYVTTGCVIKEYRNKGIMKLICAKLVNEVASELGSNVISARTWSLNDKQISLFEKYNCIKAAVIENDRGPGIDTIYYVKNLPL